MSRDVQPTNSDLSPEEHLPDRSDLSLLYERHSRESTVDISNQNESSHTNIPERIVPTKTILYLTLLLVAPTVCSYVGISGIYAIDQVSSGVGDALENRMSMIGLTILTFLPWLLSLRIIGKITDSLMISTTTLVVLYAFLAFPLASIAAYFSTSLIATSILLILTAALSYTTTSLIVNLLIADRLVKKRFIQLVCFLLAIILVAVIFQLVK